jgi:hypothetical protein
MAEAKGQLAPGVRDAPLDGTQVKPTPTQEENDRAALGEHVIDKEPDGSPPDPFVEAAQAQDKKRQEKEKEIRDRQAQAGRTHQTRQTQAPQVTQPKT